MCFHFPLKRRKLTMCVLLLLEKAKRGMLVLFELAKEILVCGGF